MGFLRGILLVMLTVIVTSCGFHPRGSLPLAPPLLDLYLKTASPYSQLTHNLREYLTASGVRLANTPDGATTILEIISEHTGQQLLSVSSTQQTRQYNLILDVNFQLTTPTGVIISPPQFITETRFVTIQSDQILGGSNEATSLYQQMRQAIAYDLMNRLASRDVTMSLMKKIP